MTQSKKSFMDKISDFTMKLAGPIGKFAEKPVIASIQDGLVATMPVIIIGSIFLILYVLGSPSIGDSGKALLPFLEDLAPKFVVVNSLTMNFLAFYTSLTISMSYGKRLNLDLMTAALLGAGTFFMINLNGVTDGMISVNAFSASGLFVTMITSIVAVRIYKLFIDKNITIRMPASVPPNVGNAFTSLIPFACIFTIAWVVRTVLDIDLVVWFTELLQPLFSAADNIWMYTFRMTTQNILWSVGLHGDNMVASVFTPLTTMWTAENAEALAQGVSGVNLPHVMTNSGVDRLTNWTATVWPLILLMITSRVKYLRSLGWACFPSAIFTIVEPVIFGLPLALNPFLIIPFILIGTIAAIVGYAAFQFGLIARFYATLPWATPPFILGPLGTGDWKTIILVIVVFLIGLVIYFPFFRAFENAELKKEAEREAAIEETA